MKQSLDYRMDCVRELQASSEWIHNRAQKDLDIEKFFRNNCCVFNRWEQCISNQLKRKCGQKSDQVFAHFIHHSSLYILKSLCHNFNASQSTSCRSEELKAPKNYIPKGLHSDSIISYLFSRNCPNVGFGIDQGRDY